MKPMLQETATTTYSCQPSKNNKLIFSFRVVIRFAIRITILPVVFLLSTSYQSQRKEIHRVENDVFIPELAKNIKNYLDEASHSPDDIFSKGAYATMPLIREWYVSTNYKPVWTSFMKLNVRAETLLGLINDSRKFGLDKSLFRIDDLRSEVRKMTGGIVDEYPQSRMNIELMMTDACLQFMIYLKLGYRDFDSTLFALPYISEIMDNFDSAVNGQNFKKDILAVQPSFIEYKNLQKALEHFLKITRNSNLMINVPDPGKDSVLFRKEAAKVLINLGYLDHNTSDTAFLTALKKFQYYHGLEPDGKPGKNTRFALNQTISEKYKKIALNLDRLRKENLPEDQFIYVNIPAFQLKIYKNNQIIGCTRVIVGAVKTPTPLVTSKIEKIITNPTWEVPRSITLNEMLPRLKSDSGYLNRNRLRILDGNRNSIGYDQVDWNTVSSENFDFMIKQDAGSDNALGRVKFIFPNPYSVYLHDTPGKQHFTADYRALSHGCVRVQHPEILADYLVREYSSNYEMDVMGMISKGTRREIALIRPADLFIHYLTCQADENFNIFFYNDIYGLDIDALKRFEFLI
jgi:L,D-transpeptidase YcbB